MPGSRYDSYNLDKGPVFYEAYYPDDHDDVYHEKRYFDRSAVLETSFQVPSDRFAYSAENANRPVPNDESSYVVVNDEENPQEKQRRNVGPRRNFVRFHDQRPMPLEDDDRSSPAANIGEISKLVRRAISRDLENWNALERYLDHTSNQGQSVMPPPSRSEVRPKESRKSTDDSYPREVNQLHFDLPKQPRLEVLRELVDVKARPAYFEEVRNDASGSVMSVADARAVDDAPIGITSDSLPLENIFQPRPQIIKYTFLKKATTRRDEPGKVAIDNTTPRNYGDNLIREEIANDSRDGELARGSVKVTSIQVSELPRHKTRHHHGELPKRDYTAHRHRSTVDHLTVQ